MGVAYDVANLVMHQEENRLRQMLCALTDRWNLKKQKQNHQTINTGNRLVVARGGG